MRAISTNVPAGTTNVPALDGSVLRLIRAPAGATLGLIVDGVPVALGSDEYDAQTDLKVSPNCYVTVTTTTAGTLTVLYD